MSIEMYPPSPPIEHSKERWIWLLISAACLFPALLSVLQPYVLARLDRTSVGWQDIVFQGSEWLFLGALTPITYYFTRQREYLKQSYRY